MRKDSEVSVSTVARLHSMNVGNVHEMCHTLNELGWSSFLITYSGSGFNGVCALLIPAGWPWDERGPLSVAQKDAWACKTAKVDIKEYRAGRYAYVSGAIRSGNESIDWRAGWDDAKKEEAKP